MNLSALDLNLLVVLDALLREASVGRAAQAVGLSQPAASHALARLRALFDDPLLARAGQRMELTPRAEALRRPVELALEQVRAVFAEGAFDPALSRRRFTLMAPDVAVGLLMPPLVARLEAEAPHTRLAVTAWRGPSMMTPDFAATLDLIVSYHAVAFPGFHRQPLYLDRDVLAVRGGRLGSHALGRLEGFLAARHVAVVARGEQADPIDVWLGELGHAREVVLTVPTYLQALHVAARTDLVAFVPGRLVAREGAPLGLRAITPPLDPGEDEQLMFHPVRLAQDPASLWLRQRVREVAAAL